MTSLLKGRSKTSAPAFQGPRAAQDSQAADEYALPVLPTNRRGIAVQKFPLHSVGEWRSRTGARATYVRSGR